MRHFKFYPKIFFPTKIGENGAYDDFHKASNIMLGIRFREVLKKNLVFYYDYVVTDEDRPDIIAHKYYGSIDYTWIIFYTNNMLDPIYDWVLTYDEFTSYLIKKYGSIEHTHQNIKEYRNKNDFVIDYDTWLATPEVERSHKTIYQWENDINEGKRNIVLLEDIYLQTVISEFKDLMKEVNG